MLCHPGTCQQRRDYTNPPSRLFSLTGSWGWGGRRGPGLQLPSCSQLEIPLPADGPSLGLMLGLSSGISVWVQPLMGAGRRSGGTFSLGSEDMAHVRGRRCQMGHPSNLGVVLRVQLALGGMPENGAGKPVRVSQLLR